MSYKLFASLLALVVGLVLAGSASAATRTLAGTVGPGFTITLKDARGKSVPSLKAGAYLFHISDRASIHNFHLTGPGLNRMTSVEAQGPTSWKLTLRAGKYHYQCDPHKTIMKGDFTVA